MLKLPFQQEAKSLASALEAGNTGLNMLLIKQGSSTGVQDEKQRHGSIFQCFHLEVAALIETPSLAFSSLRRNGVVPPDTAARHSALLGGSEVPTGAVIHFSCRPRTGDRGVRLISSACDLSITVAHASATFALAS